MNAPRCLGRSALFNSSLLLSLALGLPAQQLPGSKPGELAEVQQIGEGEQILVLLPCMSGRWRSFDSFMDRNQERYRMYAVTVPGYGGTPYPHLDKDGAGTPMRDNAIAGLEKLFADEEIEDAVLVGHSWGSLLAVEFAVRHPQMVTAIVNLDGSLLLPMDKKGASEEERLKQAEEMVREQTMKLADAEAWERLNRSSIRAADRKALHHGMFMATERALMIQYWRENFFVHSDELLAALPCPVLDIHSISTGVAEREAAARQRIADLKLHDPDGQIETVTWYDTGHFVHEERPLELDRAIEAFLNGEDVKDDLRGVEGVATPASTTVNGGRDQNVDAGGKAFQGWAQQEQRGCTRLIFFHKTVDPNKPWDSSPGEFAIEYGQPPWTENALARLEQAAFPRWRMGKNHWSNLDSRFPFVMGGVELPAGYFYLFLERKGEGDWDLCLLDPDSVRGPELDAWHANRREVGEYIRVPLEYSKSATVADKLEVELKLTDANDNRKAQLEIRYGLHRLRVEVRGVF
ncbi:MAG: alpha/beta fold hydrolase [Planctomycetota bacterium]